MPRRKLRFVTLPLLITTITFGILAAVSSAWFDTLILAGFRPQQSVIDKSSSTTPCWRIQRYSNAVTDWIYAQSIFDQKWLDDSLPGLAKSSLLPKSGMCSTQPHEGVFVEVFHIASGFPFRSMYAERIDHYKDETFQRPVANSEFCGWLATNRPLSNPPYGFGPNAMIPTHPIALGLILDTVIYSSAFWILMFFFKLLRPLRWRLIGRCTHCGYDVRGRAPLNKCPECGEWVIASHPRR